MKRIKWLFPVVAVILSACNSSSPSLSSVEESSSSESSVLSSETSNSETSSSESASSESASSSSSVSSSSSSSISSSSSSASSSSSSSSSSLSSSSETTSQIEGAIVFPTISIASNAPSYYTSISTSATGTTLKNELKNLISKNVSVSYDWSRYEYADQDLTNTNNVLTIYARQSYAKSAHVSGNTPNRWNREHTYPDSKITGAAESDNHHIFADDWKTNNDRGNKRFADLDTSNANWVIDSGGRTTQNLTNSSYFEPLDAAKGEVARATLYLNTLYGYSLDGNFQTAELAVLWALYYPVDDWAMIRNNRVYDKQKNRNPYIDNQAYTCKVYGNTTSRTAQLCANYL